MSLEKPLAGTNPMLHFQIRAPSTAVRPPATLFHGLLDSEQLTFLLFLKMADEREGLTGERQAIPAGYRWENLASPHMEGAELDQHYRDTLRVLGTRGGMLGMILE